MICRDNCGACCIYASINSSLIPGMPNGKPSGVKCIHLNADNKCNLWGLESRPYFCGDFKPEISVCGKNASEAKINILKLENLTAPNS